MAALTTAPCSAFAKVLVPCFQQVNAHPNTACTSEKRYWHIYFLSALQVLYLKCWDVGFLFSLVTCKISFKHIFCGFIKIIDIMNCIRRRDIHKVGADWNTLWKCTCKSGPWLKVSQSLFTIWDKKCACTQLFWLCARLFGSSAWVISSALIQINTKWLRLIPDEDKILITSCWSWTV